MPDVNEGDDTVKSALARIAGLRSANGNKHPGDIIRSLQRTTWEGLLALRSKASINRVLGELQRIGAEDMPRLAVESAAKLTEALELQNLLLNAEIVALTALKRTESRAGHYREDFPNRDDKNWLKAIVVRAAGGRMDLSPTVVDPDWKDMEGD